MNGIYSDQPQALQNRTIGLDGDDIPGVVLPKHTYSEIATQYLITSISKTVPVDLQAGQQHCTCELTWEWLAVRVVSADRAIRVNEQRQA